MSGDADTRPDIPPAWTAAALDAVIAHHKARKDPVWNCPSSGEVAAIITALRPLIAEAGREAELRRIEAAAAVDDDLEDGACYARHLVMPCGCGPLEPCEPHRDGGDLQDWEGRARAAEAALAAERRAFHGTLIRFAAEAVRGKHAYGLPEEPAFEALRRIGVELKKAADELAAASIRGEAPGGR